MRITFAQALLFIATIAASFLPWALKPAAVLIGYAAVLRMHSANSIASVALRSPLFWLTIWYWLALMFSAAVNSTPMAEVLRVSMPVLFVPLVAAIAELDERKQKQLLAACVLAAVVYTLRYAVVFDWSQLLNAQYRGDKDADVFVALNAAFIFAYAIEKIMLTRQRPHIRTVLFVLAFYGFIMVVLIKSRGTLAAMLLTFFYVYYRHYKSITMSRAVAYGSVTFIVVVFIWFSVDMGRMFESLSELLYLTGDGSRSLATGSGRFIIWEYVITELWPQKFWFGHGPRANLDLISEAFRIHGTHNVPLAALVDGGLMATIPILFILLLPAVLYHRNRKCVFGYQFYFIALAAALNENLLFAFGNPFAWVSLMMYAQITNFKRKVSQC